MSNAAFSFSVLVHGAILAWLITGSPGSANERPRSLYDLTIRSHEDKIIWYHPMERLPDVSPAAVSERGPARARVIHHQTLVSGNRDDSHPAPKIWLPDPVEPPKPSLKPLPNALAVAPAAPPRPVRAFVPPPVEPKTAPSLSLPDAPRPASLATPAANALASIPGKIPLRRFSEPVEEKRASPAAPLPDAPQATTATVSPAANALASIPTKAPPRRFSAPPAETRQREIPVLQTIYPEPSPVATTGSAEATLAIASLTPAATREIPKPDTSRESAFSAGPKLNPDGGKSAADPSILVVPGLLARGGDHTPAPTLVAGAARPGNLLAGVRPGLTGAAPAAPAPPPPNGTRVAEAPDPRLAGRAVYTLAIQMPNVTSYSGSWIVWFAEHGPAGEPAGIRPPSPLRKVDPKYIASAVSERVEGTVRLFATIGKDGHVADISLVKHLDERLDQSATEALGKWQFEPASRGGIPVEVDAIFEIPFRLAPRGAR